MVSPLCQYTVWDRNRQPNSGRIVKNGKNRVLKKMVYKMRDNRVKSFYAADAASLDDVSKGRADNDK